MNFNKEKAGNIFMNVVSIAIILILIIVFSSSYSDYKKRLEVKKVTKIYQDIQVCKSTSKTKYCKLFVGGHESCFVLKSSGAYTEGTFSIDCKIYDGLKLVKIKP